MDSKYKFYCQFLVCYNSVVQQAYNNSSSQ